MRNLSKTIFAALTLTLVLNFTCGQTRVIKLKTNSAGTDLDLGNDEEILVSTGDAISWVVDANVDEFLLRKKHGNHNIFGSNPEGNYVRRLDLVVTAHPMWPFRANWKYSIMWKDAAGIVRTYDPKIAVKPAGNFLPGLIFGLIIMFIPALMFFKQKQTLKVKLKEATRKYEDLLRSK